MRRLRVTFIISDLVMGGAECLLANVVSRFDPRVFNVTLLYLYGRDEIGIPPVFRSVGLGLTHAPLRYAAPRVWNIARYLRDNPCDIVHTHLQAADVLGQLAAQLVRVPVTYSTVHNIVEWTREVPSIRANVEDMLLRKLTRVIAVSDALRRDVIETRRCPPSHITTIFNGLELERFRRARMVRAQARDALGFHADDTVLLTVAQFRPEKRHDLLLAAFRQLVHCRPNMKLLLVGSNGSTRGSVESTIREWGLESSVTIKGATREEIVSCYGAADLFTMHSEFEGQPLAVLEAMAAGIPIVAPRTPYFTECIREGIEGWFFPFGDPEEHAATIHTLLRTPALTADRSASQERVISLFSVERHVAALSAMYVRDAGRHVSATAIAMHDWNLFLDDSRRAVTTGILTRIQTQGVGA
jgi:glycosyltransferase involved in cell wall biosynthesis